MIKENYKRFNVLSSGSDIVSVFWRGAVAGSDKRLVPNAKRVIVQYIYEHSWAQLTNNVASANR